MNLPQRKSPRLQGYDYAAHGAYFVTICTHERQSLFGDIIDGVMVLNEYGGVTWKALERLPQRWTNQVDLDAFVVMPNHLHAVILLTPDAKNEIAAHAPTLGDVISNYKAGVTRLMRQMAEVQN